MSSKGYTVFGWIVWRVGMRLAKREISDNRSKLIAVGVVVGVIAAGIALASGDDD
ncbi:MAG: hypothetical protein M3N56_01160 [Actinomycetota bacterium]|nr:hypothetical protein [Actinomycetota bacterium]